ncbi:MAG: hypothetical protein K2G40_09790 [Muribaculaceae bacterium]|nr:hypothetical protein [Muribaculaceae bacterium]
MSKSARILLYFILCITGCPVLMARGEAEPDLITQKLAKRPKIPVDSTVVHNPLDDEMLIVGNDTISIILPQANYGRYDRGLYNYLFIPKGQWSFGLTASYGEFSSDDVQILSIIKDLDLNIKAYSIKPSISYTIRNNQSLGIKFDFTRMTGNLGSLSFDFDDDMNFTIGDVSYYSQTYNAGIFYRNYVGLGRMKRFGVFNEVDLSFGSGSSRFKRRFNGEIKDTRTNITSASLNFSPGVAVFIMDNVAFNVSFGVFGLKLNHEKQITDGVEEGSRFTSGANFRFNIFNINLGMAIYI